MRGPIKACMDAGVAVVLIDTTLKDPSGVVSSVASDNATGGKLAADFIGQALQGKGVVSIQSGQASIRTQVQRNQGAAAEFAARYPGIRLLETTYFMTESAAQTGTTATLNGAPDVGGFFNSRGACVGPSRALDAHAGSRPTLVCYDSSDATVDLLSRKRIDALVVQPASEEGRLAMADAADFLDGKKGDIKPEVVLPPVLVRSEDASRPEIRKLFY